MTNYHLTLPTILPLMILAFIAIYLVFFRDTEKSRKEKQPHR